MVAYYMNNAKVIREGLKDAGFDVYGGVNAPYIWLQCPGGMDSWAFFDWLIDRARIVGTPGEGFGSCGEGWFRFSCFGSPEDTAEAASRLEALLRSF